MKTLFKKILGIKMVLLIVTGLSLSMISSVAYAADTTTTTAPGTTVDDLLRPFKYTSGASNDQSSKIVIVSNIANRTGGAWTDILAGVIQFALGVTGALAFISFTYAGVLMVSARGNEEQIKKGKQILLWSILALAIIATSYALVLGISQLKF